LDFREETAKRRRSWGLIERQEGREISVLLRNSRAKSAIMRSTVESNWKSALGLYQGDQGNLSHAMSIRFVNFFFQLSFKKSPSSVKVDIR
jgi:hypothetical protein